MFDKKPKIILLFSGKRKSGKDTFTDLLFGRVKNEAAIIKLSAPIKLQFSKNQGLDYKELMGTSSYKEQYRLEMIKWSEQVRHSDPGYFCRAAIEMEDAAMKPVWIVSDMRRRTDLMWFRGNYHNVKTIRICSTDEERRNRGWVFTPGIDDQETECDLDDVTDWDVTIQNNGNLTDLETDIDLIVNMIKEATDEVS